ncbi:MAG: hypothetical protein ABJA49_18290 [Betaproteobacteria bacterium]
MATEAAARERSATFLVDPVLRQAFSLALPELMPFEGWLTTMAVPRKPL